MRETLVAQPRTTGHHRGDARLRFETFLADVAVRFLKQPSDQIGLEIDGALARLADILDLDRSVLALFSSDLAQLNIEHSFTRPGIPALVHRDLARRAPWYTEQLREGQRVLIEDRASVERLPPEAAAERTLFESAGLRSHVSLPLIAEGGPLGMLGVTVFDRERKWSEAFLARLELLASAFAGALYRRRAEARIRAAEDLNRSVLGSLSSELLVLDSDGRVLIMNDVLRRSAHQRLLAVEEGSDYRAALAGAAERGFADALRLSEGLASVLSGQSPRFETTYAIPGSPDDHYLVRVTPLEGRPGAVVLHGDVSELERQRAALEKDLQEIEEQKDRLEAEHVVLHREATQARRFRTLIGRSAAMARVQEEIEQVAATDSPVLLMGETGTGKDLAARLVHGGSRRRDEPFVIVNCAALPVELIESELFGHERGAFTGADRRVVGRFEIADGGTLFLDEVGELPLEVQATLLRVLDSGEFQRLGSPRTLKTDVRLIAATNRDLTRARQEGRFRSDLYYRLGVLPIVLPPLRDRPEDIPLLVWHFIAQKQARLGASVERVPTALMQALTAHSWPGNVRELEHVIERALILTRDGTLAADPAALRKLGMAMGEPRGSKVGS
jgi:formate hydrogenlyase transcriptional activator